GTTVLVRNMIHVIFVSQLLMAAIVRYEAIATHVDDTNTGGKLHGVGIRQQIPGALDILENLFSAAPLKLRTLSDAPTHQGVRVDTRTLAAIGGAETVISGRGID